MSSLYLDRDAASGVISRMKQEISEMQASANRITARMNELRDAWQGISAERAQQTYETDYRKMLTTNIPDTMNRFSVFLDHCIAEIYRTDESLGR